MNIPPISPDQFKIMKQTLSDTSYTEWTSIKECLPNETDITQFKKIYAWKKADVYKDNLDKAPKWLADEFNIMWIKYSELIPEGHQFFMPYAEFVSNNLFREEDTIYEEVILWKHKDHGENVLDIDMTMTSLF